MEIISWNVNGIRAVHKKGELENLLLNHSPDILCIQETKANRDQLGEEILNIGSYTSYFQSATVKKGYSGVAIYSKVEPLHIKDMGIDEFDGEGRFIEAKYDNFTLINCYFPNSQEKGKRLDYKLEFCNSLLKYCNSLIDSGENVILCGDYNIAHKEIDLKNPKRNEQNPGFLPEEREWMTSFLTEGYVDVFRTFYPEEIKYTWWSYRFGARGKNIGWRIDYHCVNSGFLDNVEDVKILDEVMGSDHCPVSIILK